MKLKLHKIIGVMLIITICCIEYFVFDRAAEHIFFYSVFGGSVLVYLYRVDRLHLSQQIARINAERLDVALLHIRTVMFDNVLEADITQNKILGDNAEQMVKMLGLTKDADYDEILDAIVNQITAPEFKTEYWHMMSRDNIIREYEAGKVSFEYECIERSDKIHYRWIRLHIYIYRSKVTDSIRIIAYIKNIDHEKRQLIDLMERSQLDSMTGVYNRNSIPYIVENSLRSQPDLLNAIILIDIDKFKIINDTRGHIVGDKVIRETAKILKNAVRPTDFVARMGGDEFLVFLVGISQPEDALKKAADIQNIVRNEDLLPLENIKWSFSMGVRIIASVGNFEELYHDADLALYRAKENGRDQYCSHCEINK